jgi:uncharacterized protein
MKSLPFTMRLLLTGLGGVLVAGACQAVANEDGSQQLTQESIRVLLIDGQNNHRWEETTPVLVDALEGSGRFQVDVLTSPPEGEDISAFRASFAEYDVVVSNYNGEAWPEPMQRDFVAFVHSGGGFVPVHAANNAFGDWPEYNEIIAVGGWDGRNDSSGPYLRLRDGQWVRDTETPGTGGGHGSRHEFLVDTQAPDHPIMRDLPSSWMHAEDELYDRLRGPARNVTVLASAYSDPETRGTGEHEPILMTVDYGEGRVFHTTLGHDVTAMRGLGFQITLLRGTEWAATGRVTIPVPGSFQNEELTSRQAVLAH